MASLIVFLNITSWQSKNLTKIQTRSLLIFFKTVQIKQLRGVDKYIK